jgi:hypothetical protein
MLHPSQHQLHVTPLGDPLYVIAAIDNPEMYATRYKHFHAFAKHIEDSGAILYTIEVATGGRHFEVTQAGHPRHIQLRAQTELWRKENLQNIGVAHLPHDWKYVALCDADFLNTRPDWVQETLQALQRYDAVQLFSTFSSLKADHTVESTSDGFVYAWTKSRPLPAGYSVRGAPGGEWAYRRSAWESVEGLLQTPILGSADWYMSYALAGLSDTVKDTELGKCAPQYIAAIKEWCDRARALNGNIWYLDNHAIHYWHGPIAKRGYGWRWKILGSNCFDPYKDLKTEHSGLLELRGNKPRLRDEIRAYFRSRQEDSL